MIIEDRKIDVMFGDDSTPISINHHVFELAKRLDGTPAIQDLIDEAVDDYDMTPGDNPSAWVTSLIAVAASKQLEDWGARL